MCLELLRGRDLYGEVAGQRHIDLFQFGRGLKHSVIISTHDCVPFESVSTSDHENYQRQQRAKVCLMRTLTISNIEPHTLAKHVDRLYFLS